MDSVQVTILYNEVISWEFTYLRQIRGTLTSANAAQAVRDPPFSL
jgi:hypothetical protein